MATFNASAPETKQQVWDCWITIAIIEVDVKGLIIAIVGKLEGGGGCDGVDGGHGGDDSDGSDDVSDGGDGDGGVVITI